MAWATAIGFTTSVYPVAPTLCFAAGRKSSLSTDVSGIVIPIRIANWRECQNPGRISGDRKLEGNRDRDERNRAMLDRKGWRELVVWECECGQTEHLKNKIRGFLDDDQGNAHAGH
jgi:hypothetical protein